MLDPVNHGDTSHPEILLIIDCLDHGRSVGETIATKQGKAFTKVP